ncbi:unnamed protein product [Closterium sp. Yama58-4]|nr:unnamed protein product [Closterium sp. Yama58-4]
MLHCPPYAAFLCVTSLLCFLPMAPIDPHSNTQAGEPLTTFVDFNLTVDFDNKQISGTARLVLDKPATGTLSLDSRDLTILGATDAAGNDVPFQLHPPHHVRGSLLELSLNSNEVTIRYHTGPNASALQWLTPVQTAGGQHPYVFTQCQAIHARSVFPCQDTPQARIKYHARVKIPAGLHAVMSAQHVATEQTADAARVEEVFEMEQPIPPYLFALAVGDIASKTLSPRVKVYAEPSQVEAAAYEFSETEDKIKAAEALFGPYGWGDFNLLLMPPAFPYGGMENPRCTFLTPTLLAGDRSLASVVAHELAHSWTGNLVTNADYSSFWLNEGWTVYAERRILEATEGEEKAKLDAAMGWLDLQKGLSRFTSETGSSSRRFTQLDLGTDGLDEIDPDEVFSEVPYEKGFFFLTRLEKAVGRAAFDAFITKYISKFAFQSITTATFLDFLKAELPRVMEKGSESWVDVEEWVRGQGMLAEAESIVPQSARLASVQRAARGFVEDPHSKFGQADASDWGPDEWQIFLAGLPRTLPVETLVRLDEEFGFSKSKNAEIRVGFLTVAAQSGATQFHPEVESTLMSVGRMKYLRPLYTALIKGGAKDMAERVFEAAKAGYHPIRELLDMEESGDNGSTWEARPSGTRDHLSPLNAEGGDVRSQTPAASDGYASDTGPEGHGGGSGKGAGGGNGSSHAAKERKKGIPWTEEEHRLFLVGLCKLGKGDWRGIARSFVVTRTPTQVASHAQKYFNRQNNLNKRKRRSSLFDINTYSILEERMDMTRSLSTPTLPLAPEDAKCSARAAPTHDPPTHAHTPRSSASSPKIPSNLAAVKPPSVTLPSVTLPSVTASPPPAYAQHASLLDLNRSHSYPVVPAAGDSHLPRSLSRPMSLPSLTPANPTVHTSADVLFPPADVIHPWRIPGVPDPWGASGYPAGGRTWPPHPAGPAVRPDAVYPAMMMMDPAVRHRMGYEMLLRMEEERRQRAHAVAAANADTAANADADADVQGAEKKCKVENERGMGVEGSVHKELLPSKFVAGASRLSETMALGSGPNKSKVEEEGGALKEAGLAAAAAQAVAVPVKQFPPPFSPPHGFYPPTYHSFPDPSFMYMWPPYPPPPLNLGCSWQPPFSSGHPSSPGGASRVLRPTAMLATSPLHVPVAVKERAEGVSGSAKEAARKAAELQEESSLKRGGDGLSMAMDVRVALSIGRRLLFLATVLGVFSASISQSASVTKEASPTIGSSIQDALKDFTRHVSSENRWPTSMTRVSRVDLEDATWQRVLQYDFEVQLGAQRKAFSLSEQLSPPEYLLPHLPPLAAPDAASINESTGEEEEKQATEESTNGDAGKSAAHASEGEGSLALRAAGGVYGSVSAARGDSLLQSVAGSVLTSAAAGSLPPVTVEGPMEMWVQDAEQVRLAMPHDVDAGDVRKVVLASGAAVTVHGAQAVALARPLQLPLPTLSRRSLSASSASSALLALAEKLKAAALSWSSPSRAPSSASPLPRELVSLRVVRPSAIVAASVPLSALPPARDVASIGLVEAVTEAGATDDLGNTAAATAATALAPAKLRVKRIAAGAVELTSARPRSTSAAAARGGVLSSLAAALPLASLTAPPGPWPFPVVNRSDGRLTALGEALQGALGEMVAQQGKGRGKGGAGGKGGGGASGGLPRVFQLVKASASAGRVVRIPLQVELRVEGVGQSMLPVALNNETASNEDGTKAEAGEGGMKGEAEKQKVDKSDGRERRGEAGGKEKGEQGSVVMTRQQWELVAQVDGGGRLVPVHVRRVGSVGPSMVVAPHVLFPNTTASLPNLPPPSRLML